MGALQQCVSTHCWREQERSLAAQLTEILSVSQYCQVQNSSRRSCNVSLKVKYVTTYFYK